MLWTKTLRYDDVSSLSRKMIFKIAECVHIKFVFVQKHVFHTAFKQWDTNSGSINYRVSNGFSLFTSIQC